jgi:prepilin-type processing-associated H-X9-DG protein
MVGWQMYAQENHDKILVVLHGGAAQGGAGDPTWGAGWVAGWLDWTLSTDNTNTAFLTNPRYARIAPYLGGSTNIFKCPADNYLSTVQQARGWSQRARSYSASLAIGSGNAQTGPWDSLYHQITKISDIQFPGPAQTFVYLDEHPDSMNDPGFFSPHQTALVDLPATYHNDAATFSFADGHSELHKWSGCLTQPRARQVLDSYTLSLISSAGDPDIHWLSFHTQRVSSNSY